MVVAHVVNDIVLDHRDWVASEPGILPDQRRRVRGDVVVVLGDPVAFIGDERVPARPGRSNGCNPKFTRSSLEGTFVDQFFAYL